MRNRRVVFSIILLLLSLLVFFPPAGNLVRAQSAVPTPLDLINAINELRASFGLPPLEINSILMGTAQAHANYQASIGTVTHYGADGSRPYNRALAAGYGGGSDVVISENIAVVYGEVDMHRLLYNTWADEAHWNTMTKSTYKHIGAGVSQSDGKVYFTIDVGWIKGGVPVTAGSTSSSSSDDSNGDDTTSQIIMPVEVATPLPDGTILHQVMPGQAMWSIAVAYKVKIVDIANLNHMSPTDPVIYAGQELLIQPSYTPTIEGFVQSTSTPIDQKQQVVIPSSTPTTFLPGVSTQIPLTATPEPTLSNDRTTINIILVIACGLAALIIVSLIIPKGKT